MQFVNSRQPSAPVPFSTAILNTLSSDGGLLIPEAFPTAPPLNDENFPEYASRLLALYLQGDPYAEHVAQCAHRAFTFSPSISTLGEHHLLELFHGPSLSFKDFGAQFLAQFLTHVPQQRERLIVVATSGDTGSAVAAAFHQKTNTRVVILYPANGVSQRQAHQLSCWGDNVTTFAVDGTFDQCQAMVKTALQDPTCLEAFDVTTANSINIGRLLPQVAYYAYASFRYHQQRGYSANVIVPSGNLGNVTACCWAKAMGCPIDRVVIAQNANRTVVDYCQTGDMLARPSVATLANAMDVGNPSNFLRLQALYPTLNAFCNQLTAYSVNDREIENTIRHTHQQHGVTVCPHTATAVHVLPSCEKTAPHWLIAATAHPSKFESIVEPLINETIELPKRLATQLNKPSNAIDLSANFAALTAAIQSLT